MSQQTETVIKEKIAVVVKSPSMYRVILHNDDKTTFDFVIAVLTNIFHKSVEDSTQITLDIHEHGAGVAGEPYTKEIAEEKAMETMSFAKRNKFPLVATTEEIS